MNYSKDILKKLDINIQFFLYKFLQKLLSLKQRCVIIYTQKILRRKSMKNIELIKKWNEEKGGNFGIYLPLGEENYIEIGNEILILKEMKLYFKNINNQESENFSVEVVINGLPINMHSTLENLGTVIYSAQDFVTEGINFKFDFINGIVEIAIGNSSKKIPLFLNSEYTENSDLMFLDFKGNIKSKGRELCKEIGNKELLRIFEN